MEKESQKQVKPLAQEKWENTKESEKEKDSPTKKRKVKKSLEFKHDIKKGSPPPISSPASSDKPSRQDNLEREKYVKVIAALITNRDTEVPLTIGIYGSWGSGKSSFMLQLQDKVSPQLYTINFNPWRHDDAGELWYALMNEIAQALDKILPFRIKLNLLLNQPEGLEGLIRKTLVRSKAAGKKFHNWLITGSAIGIYNIDKISPGFGSNTIDAISLWFGINNINDISLWLLPALLIPVFLWKGCRTLSRPIQTQMEAYRHQSSEEKNGLKKITLMELNDIRKFFEMHLKIGDKDSKKVVIFLDDLDRCSPNQIVEVLEAVHLCLEGLPFFTVLGLDSKVVSHAVASRYDFMLKEDASPIDKEAYGHYFLQKIINIPFQMPPARVFQNFLNSLLVPHTNSIVPEKGEKINLEDFLYGKQGRKEGKFSKNFYYKAVSFLYDLLVYLNVNLFLEGNLSKKDLIGVSIYMKIFHGLELKPNEQDWINQQPLKTRSRFEAAKLDASGSNLFNPLMIFNYEKTEKQIRKELEQQELQEKMEIAEVDLQNLGRLARELKGNPRSVKRLVNIYKLCKAINAQLEPASQIDIKKLSTWLVLLQNWPKDGSILYGWVERKRVFPKKNELQSHPLKKLAPDLLDYILQHESDLSEVIGNEQSMELTRCFSFLSPEELSF